MYGNRLLRRTRAPIASLSFVRVVLLLLHMSTSVSSWCAVSGRISPLISHRLLLLLLLLLLVLLLLVLLLLCLLLRY
jgi:hypothetical protein